MKKLIYIFCALLLAGIITSCESTKVVPEEATAAQIIQMGQNAYTSAHYKDAEFFYNTAIDRFGSDPKTYIEAKYELGHIYVKTKNYEKAKACFNEILDLYSLDATGQLPGTYKKLAQIGLAKMEE